MTNVESSLKGSTWRGSSWHEKKLVGWWVVAKPTCFLGRIQVLFKTQSVYCKRKCVNNIATSPYLWLQIMTWQRLSGCSWRFWTTSSRTIRSDHSGSSKWSFRGSFVILNQGGRCGLRTCFETSQVTNVSPAKNFINSRIQNIPERYNKQYIYIYNIYICIYVYIILYNTYIYICIYTCTTARWPKDRFKLLRSFTISTCETHDRHCVAAASTVATARLGGGSFFL